MQANPDTSPDLEKLAAELAQLVPRHGLDRDRLVFVAGKASASRRNRRLPAAGLSASVLLTFAAVLYSLMAWRERSISVVAAPTPPVETRPTAANSLRVSVNDAISEFDAAENLAGATGLFGSVAWRQYREEPRRASPAEQPRSLAAAPIVTTAWSLLRELLPPEVAVE